MAGTFGTLGEQLFVYIAPTVTGLFILTRNIDIVVIEDKKE
jgi:hypothetical protein